MKQQHNTDCTFHKEPAMLQTPSLKHLVHGLQGLAWQSVDPEPSGWSTRTECWKVWRAWLLQLAHTSKVIFFPCASGHSASVLASVWEYILTHSYTTGSLKSVLTWRYS